MRTFLTLSALVLATASFAQVGVDGILGSEWTGVTPKSIAYDPTVATDFSTINTANNSNTYDIYLRADAGFVYALLLNTDTDPTHVPNFTGANLYFSTTLGSSSSGGQVGFEVTNNRAFRPQTGASGTTSITGGGGSYATVLNSGVEVAFPWAVFTENSLGVPDLTPLSVAGNDTLTMTISQSFGYSPVGGAAFGPGRLGQVVNVAPVPEPASMAVLGLGLAALKRRRKNA